MKAGDYVVIIPNEKHISSVKKHYDKVLKITKTLTDLDGDKLYFVNGVGNCATKEDLRLATNEEFVNYFPK